MQADLKKRGVPAAVAALVILLAAYVIRALSLAQQSLWLDEVYSIWFVNRPLAEAWRVCIFPDQNPHAPLYYLALWGWIRLAGVSEFAVRYLSLACGVLSVAALWRLVADLFSRRAALLACLLFAVSPFAVWYAQEARMYAQYLLFAVLSTWALVRATGLARPPAPHPAQRGRSRDDARLRWWLAYVACAVMMAYSHYFGVFTIAAQLVVGLAATWKRWRRLLALVGAGVLIGTACLPIPFGLLGSGRTFDTHDTTRAFLPLDRMAQELLAEYSARVRWSDVPLPWLILIPIAVLVLIGAWRAWRRGWRTGLLVTAALALPPLLYFPLSFSITAFAPKYVISTFPFFILCLSLAMEVFSRCLRLAGYAAALAVVAVFALAVLRDLTRPEFQREDWRYVGEYLARTAQPTDRILAFADYIAPVLAWYYPGPAKIVPFAGDPQHPESFFDWVQSEPSSRVLWLLLSHDAVTAANHRLLDVSGARYPWAYAQYPTSGNIRLLGYTMRWRYGAVPDSATPVEGRFANGLELVGYRADMTRLAPTERVSHPPSNWIHLVTYWRRWTSIDPAGAHPLVRLVDAAGGEWGGNLPRSPSVFDFDPPEKWEDGAIVEAHFDINLNPVTAPGAYTLFVGLEKDGQRLPAANGQPAVILTPIEITP